MQGRLRCAAMRGLATLLLQNRAIWQLQYRCAFSADQHNSTAAPHPHRIARTHAPAAIVVTAALRTICAERASASSSMPPGDGAAGAPPRAYAASSFFRARRSGEAPGEASSVIFASNVPEAAVGRFVRCVYGGCCVGLAPLVRLGLPCAPLQNANTAAEAPIPRAAHLSGALLEGGCCSSSMRRHWHACVGRARGCSGRCRRRRPARRSPAAQQAWALRPSLIASQPIHQHPGQHQPGVQCVESPIGCVNGSVSVVHCSRRRPRRALQQHLCIARRCQQPTCAANGSFILPVSSALAPLYSSGQRWFREYF